MAKKITKTKKLYRDLFSALKAMPKKRLYDGEFAKKGGKCCALGVLAKHRGMSPYRIQKQWDALPSIGDIDYDMLSEEFDAPVRTLRNIIMLNDGPFDFCTPEERYERVYHYVSKRLRR